jgi:hypothetical protein
MGQYIGPRGFSAKSAAKCPIPACRVMAGGATMAKAGGHLTPGPGNCCERV